MLISGAAKDIEYFPAMQFAHMEDPRVFLYVPRIQATHEPPSGPVYPVLQMHAVDTLLLDGDIEFKTHDMHVVLSRAAVDVEYVPAKQSMHIDDPGVSLYVPTRHASQDPPLEPVYPALHKHAVCTLLADGDCEFGGQLPHVWAEIAPVVLEYLPVEHSLHNCDPLCGLYVPGIHKTHVSPSSPVDPALQVQLCMYVADTGELEPGGQSSQAGVMSFDHVPDGHGSHDSIPTPPDVSDENPPGHFEHT